MKTQRIDQPVGDGDIVSIKIFAKQNPSFSEGALRFLRFNGGTNGALEAGVFVELAGRIYVHKPAFFRYLLDGQKSRKATPHGQGRGAKNTGKGETSTSA